MDRHRERFANNRRMDMPLRTLGRMSDERIAALRTEASNFLDRMDRGDPV